MSSSRFNDADAAISARSPLIRPADFDATHESIDIYDPPSVCHGDATPPRDQFFITFVFLILLGALSFPFCALVASPHFLVTYYNGFGVADPPTYRQFWTNAPSIVSGIFCVLNIPFQILAIRIRDIAPLKQMRAIFMGTAVVIAVLPLCPVIFTHASEESTIVVLMVVTVLLTICSAAAQSLVFGLQAKFPKVYSVTASIGVGVSGLVAALLRLIPALITTTPSAANEMMEAHVFFGIVAVANLVAGIGAPMLLTRFPFAAHYYLQRVPNSTSIAAAASDEAGGDSQRPPSIHRDIMDLYFVAFMSMFGSYCMYPGVSARDVANDRLWGVVVFMAWNAGSTFGRTMCVKTPVPNDPAFVRRALVALMVIRLPIICGPSLAGLYAPSSLGDGHAASIVVQTFSGLTNGFAAAYTFRIAAHVLPNNHEKASTMRLLVFAMACGVGFGCVIGMVLCLTA
jgi:hypothetical protein